MSIINLIHTEPGVGRKGHTFYQGHGRPYAHVFTDGQAFVLGVPPALKPVHNLPDGARVRFRFRAGCIGLAFVRTADGVTRHEVDDHGDHWRLGLVVGSNIHGPCPLPGPRNSQTPPWATTKVVRVAGSREMSFDVQYLAADRVDVIILNGRRFVPAG